MIIGKDWPKGRFRGLSKDWVAIKRPLNKKNVISLQGMQEAFYQSEYYLE
jgi:hypothetical protein